MRLLFSKYSLLLAIVLFFSFYTGHSQTGFSKSFNYPYDTLRRDEMCFSNLIFDTVSQNFILPYISREIAQNTPHFSNVWIALNHSGNIVKSKIESIPNAGNYENHRIMANPYDQNSFFSAGNYFQWGDSFMTIFVQKLDKNFNVIWRKDYPTEATKDILINFIPLEDSGFILIPNLGRDSIDVSYPQLKQIVRITKIDSIGNIQWEKKIDSLETVYVNDAKRTKDGAILLCGITTGYGHPTGASFVMKVDTAGNKLWHEIFSTSDYNGFEKIVTNQDGNFAIAGWTRLNPEIQDMPNGAGRVVKIDNSGTTIWDKIIDISPRPDEFRSIIETPQGDIIALGSSAKYYAYDSYNYEVGSTREPEGWAVKLDANGNELWSRVFGHNEVPFAHDYLYNALPLPDGGFIATGTTQVADTAWSQGVATPYVRQAAWVVKLDSDGCIAPSCPWNLSEYQS